MKYLITGITGFLGPHLANLLIDQGHEVYGLVRIRNGRENDIRDIVPVEKFEKIRFVYGDLSNLRALQGVFRETKFDGVFHLAGQTHPPTSFKDMPGTWEANVTGSVNLITAITDYQPQTKLLFCSTVEVYGNTGIDEHKLKETDPLLPANPYGASKAAIDLFLQERMANKQLNAVVVRPFCFTGPRRGASYSISSDALQIAKMMLGKQEKILRIGNLDTTRAVTDVRDIAKGLALIMENQTTSGEVLNICGGKPLKMRYYTETLLKLSGLEGVVQTIDPALWRPIDIQFQDGDSSKLKEMTGWQPTIDIDTTLQDLLDYWVRKLSASPN
jgi:GDP-4-dehydro-6-deoxy-D-mannose reductase